MDHTQFIPLLRDLLQRLNLPCDNLPESARETAETLIAIDAASVELKDNASTLITLVQLCQSTLSHLIQGEGEKKEGNHRQIEKLQGQNKKLRHMLQLHQRSFIPSIVNSNCCPHCSKSFTDDNLLETHFHRRHDEKDGESSIYFPLLEKINQYQGKSKMRNERLDELTAHMNELRDKLQLAEEEIKCEKEAREQLNATIAQQVEEKVSQIEKKLQDYYSLPNDVTNCTDGQLQSCNSYTQEAFVRAQVTVLQQLAREVASLKMNLVNDRQALVTNCTPRPNVEVSTVDSYQQVEHFVKKRFDELNIQYDSSGISESDLENALKCIEEQRAGKQAEAITEEIAEQGTPSARTRPIPAARASKGPTGILKKSKSNDQFEASRESKKIQWSQ